LSAAKLKIPSVDYFKGVESMEHTAKQKVLNTGRAYVRAMMQINFLPKEDIKYINDNTTQMAINPDAKLV